MTTDELFLGIEKQLIEFRDEAYQEGYKKAQEDKRYDPIGNKNICFSYCDTLPSEDERLNEYKEQRITRGFDDTELWNLDETILKFILPRLREFRKHHAGYPSSFGSEEEWNKALDKMIASIKEILDNDGDANCQQPTTKVTGVLAKKYEGWELFKEHFFDLWS